MYLLILNIPKEFHCTHARNYFSYFTEKDVFHCFHYRHRPQGPVLDSIRELKIEPINSEKHDNLIEHEAHQVIKKLDSICSEPFFNQNSNCCILKIQPDYCDAFVLAYHGKFWVDLDGETTPFKCFVVDVGPLIAHEHKESDQNVFKTKKEHLLDTKKFFLNNLNVLIEFTPPYIMPRGNVGTPTKHFTDLIKSCELPSSLIGKLGLQLNKKRKRRYEKVHMDYGTTVQPSCAQTDNPNVIFTSKGDLIPNYHDKTVTKKKSLVFKGVQLELADEMEDGNEVEEWDRHETFKDDVGNQGRNKEHIYEPEIEQVWEKGGPGVVFYTDAQYWKEKEGDFDEQTTDQWDVDMSGYYEPGEGDIDAQASASMRESDGLSSGKHSASVFKVPKTTKSTAKVKGPWRGPEKIGKFEAYTKGFGRRLMESQGWKEGNGLGSSTSGIAYALDSDGQHPLDKKGFGYHGEKIIFAQPKGSCSKTTRVRKSTKNIISTAYDRPQQVDPQMSVHRTQEPTTMKHRGYPYPIRFSKGS